MDFLTEIRWLNIEYVHASTLLRGKCQSISPQNPQDIKIYLSSQDFLLLFNL